GLIALLTPCVWPLIPMTVSFFLKKGKTRRESIRDAMIYGSSIVVIYLVLGLAITMIFGASKLNELSTNAIFNLIFFLLLVVFAISFFGAFDIKLPSKWSNTVDNKAERATGLISIFFMAFTLALVSFSCTGPIIGTLLVEAASSGDIAGPAIGMTGFAIALALPFTLFAIFPSWLKEMPKSGGWLNSVKVVLGFIELALSLKFLSVADLAYGWGLVDREVFLALWIVIFLLLGMYLLGKIRFSHDEPVEHLSVTRFFLSIMSLSFMVYLIPGLWGAPLKGVSAFVPPLYTQDFSLYAGGDFEEFDDYETGMKYAAENNRPVLVDFSGYGCVNCRKMEGAVFDTEVVKDIIEKDYVLIKLMVDDKHDLTEPMVVTENGKEKTLYTVGDKWSYLQRYKFGANTQPYYVVLDGKTGDAMTTSRSYNENITEFVEWLDEGINNYKKAE
ncbi:MAG: thioredoxin family protein, partial [Muribaculaceae bacterium]|nr:thioredoxin family protein [Muribaculaceae bacterium]